MSTFLTGDDFNNAIDYIITKAKRAISSPYSIRIDEEIAFNPKRPFCYKAYKSWAKFENYDFPEKYCHKTGEASNGKTSMAHLILED